MDKQTLSARFMMRYRRPKILLGVAAIILVVLLIGWRYANKTAERKLVAQISETTGLDAKVGQVALTLSGITAHDITLGDPAQPTIVAKRLTIDAPLGELLKDDPQLETIRLDLLKLRLSVDEHGELTWPLKGGAESGLSQRVEIVDGTVEIHQPGREPLIVAGLNMAIVETGDGFKFQGDVVDLANARWEGSGEGDFQGGFRAQVKTDEIQLNTRELSRLPFVPESFGPLAASGRGALAIQLTKNIGESSVRSNVLIDRASFDLPQLELSLNDTSANLVVSATQLEVNGFSAAMGDGRLKGHATISLIESPFTGSFRIEFVDIPAEEIRTAISLAEYVDGVATGVSEGNLTVTDAASMRISLRGSGIVEKASVKGINLDSMKAELTVQEFSIGFDEQATVRGELTLHDLQVQNVPIATVLERVKNELDGTNFPITGNISAVAKLVVPLHSPADISTWNASGELKSDWITASGITARSLKASVELDEGIVRVDEFTIGDQAPITGSAVWPLEGDGIAEFNLRGDDVPVASLVNALPIGQAGEPGGNAEDARTNEWNLDGTVNFEASLRLPTTDFEHIESWTGRLNASSRLLSWHDVSLGASSLACVLNAGVLHLEQASARVQPSGHLTAKAAVPFAKHDQLKLTFDGDRLELRTLAAISSKLSPRLADLLEKHTETVGAEALFVGSMNIKGSVRTIWQDVASPEDWTTQAQLEAEDVMAFGIHLQAVEAQLATEDGILKVSRGQVALGGTAKIEAAASLPLSERKAAVAHDARVRWTELPLSRISQLFGTNVQMGGTTSGRFRAVVREGSPAEIRNVNGEGELAVDDATFGGLSFGDAQGEISLRDGRLFARTFRRGKQRKPVEAKLAIDAYAPFAFAAEIDAADVPLSDFIAAPKIPVSGVKYSLPPVAGLMSIWARAQGDLAHEPLSARGRLAVRQLSVDERRLSDVQLQFATIDNGVDRARVVGTAFGGRVSIEADLPTASAVQKQMSIKLRELDMNQLTWAMKFPDRELKCIGRLDVTATFSAWNNPAASDVSVQLRGASATYADIPIHEISADFTIRQDEAAVNLKGKALDGELSIEGAFPMRDDAADAIPLNVHLQTAQLEGLAKASPRYAQLMPLSGVGDLRLNLKLSLPDNEVSGDGSLLLRELQWDRVRIASSAKSNLLVNKRFVELQNISVDLRRGSVNGRIDWPLAANDTGSYDLTVRRADVASVLDFTSLRDARASGTINARLSGRLGQQIRGRGDVAIDRLSISGASASSLRVPVTYAIRLKERIGTVKTKRATARVAGGQIVTDGRIDFGRQPNLDVRMQISKVDSGQLIRSPARAAGYNQGRLSGVFELEGTGIRTIRDVTGRFQGKLEDSQAMQLPVMSDLASFANIGSVMRSSFESEKIDLRLANGIVSTPGFVLQSGRAELFIQGQVNVNQRLDLDVALQTGNVNPDFGLGGLIESPVARLGAPGLTTAMQALDFLSNRVIYLHVGGTVRSPSFQLRTDQLVRDALLRYYLPATQYQQIRQFR